MLRADAIVLLGCRIAPSGRPAGPAARRAATAAQAFHQGVAPTVIASGGRRWGSVAEAIALHRALVQAGVPDDAVVDELCSFSTCDNALFSAALLRKLAASSSPRAAVVTCPWHMDRALQSFRAIGVDAFPLPTEAAPASLSRRAYRWGHELVCRQLDARALRGAHLLAEIAEAHHHAPPIAAGEAT